MKIATFDPATTSYWQVEAAIVTLRKYDNGYLVSIGWTVGEDLPRATFRRLKKTRIEAQTWKHSGCLSRCVARGDARCQY